MQSRPPLFTDDPLDLHHEEPHPILDGESAHHARALEPVHVTREHRQARFVDGEVERAWWRISIEQLAHDPLERGGKRLAVSRQ